MVIIAQQSAGVWLLDIWEYSAAVRSYWQHSIPGTWWTWVITEFPLCTELHILVTDDKVYTSFRHFTSDNAKSWLNESQLIGTLLYSRIIKCIFWKSDLMENAYIFQFLNLVTCITRLLKKMLQTQHNFHKCVQVFIVTKFSNLFMQKATSVCQIHDLYRDHCHVHVHP